MVDKTRSEEQTVTSSTSRPYEVCFDSLSRRMGANERPDPPYFVYKFDEQLGYKTAKIYEGHSDF